MGAPPAISQLLISLAPYVVNEEPGDVVHEDRATWDLHRRNVGLGLGARWEQKKPYGFLGENILWEFQNPKMAVLYEYHLRPFFVVIFHDIPLHKPLRRPYI